MSWGDDGLLWNAVHEAVEPIAHLETQLDRIKLEKRVREYFTKGAKNLDYGSKSWDALVNEYCDNVYSSLFCGLGDREWLADTDFLLVVDAGIKDLFPRYVIQDVPQWAFEQTVLRASDRACDVQRYWSYRWETIQREVTGKVTQKKVRDACDSGREVAYERTLGAQGKGQSGGVEAFVFIWASAAITSLARVTQGDPASLLPEEQAVRVFQALVQEGGLPLPLVQEEGVPPKDWPAVAQAVAEAYKPGGTSDAPKGYQASKGQHRGYYGKASAFGGEACGGDAEGFEGPPAKKWKAW